MGSSAGGAATTSRVSRIAKKRITRLNAERATGSRAKSMARETTSRLAIVSRARSNVCWAGTTKGSGSVAIASAIEPKVRRANARGSWGVRLPARSADATPKVVCRLEASAIDASAGAMRRTSLKRCATRRCVRS